MIGFTIFEWFCLKPTNGGEKAQNIANDVYFINGVYLSLYHTILLCFMFYKYITTVNSSYSISFNQIYFLDINMIGFLIC